MRTTGAASKECGKLSTERERENGWGKLAQIPAPRMSLPLDSRHGDPAGGQLVAKIRANGALRYDRKRTIEFGVRELGCGLLSFVPG